MLLLRFQVLNTAKGGKKNIVICAPLFVLQTGRRQLEKLLLATRGHWPSWDTSPPGPPAPGPAAPKLPLLQGHLNPRRSVGFKSFSCSPDGDGDKTGPEWTKFRQESRYSRYSPHLGEIRSAGEELGATSVRTKSGERFRARFRPSLQSHVSEPWNTWLTPTPGDGMQRS